MVVIPAHNLRLQCVRDSFGDTAIVGDVRWTGKFGIAADLVARDHCSIEFISTKDIEVP